MARDSRRWLGRVASPILIPLLLSALGACGSQHQDRPLLAALNQTLFDHGRLCTAQLLLPDRTPDGARRKPFEDLMVAKGILVRSQVTTMHGVRLTKFDVSAVGRRAVLVLRRPSASQPELGRICFGSISATRIIGERSIAPGRSLATFRYAAKLEPWAQTLYPYLHLRANGTGTAYVMPTDDPQRPFVSIIRTPGPGIVLWPPAGLNWYPGVLPPELRLNDKKYLSI